MNKENDSAYLILKRGQQTFAPRADNPKILKTSNEFRKCKVSVFRSFDEVCGAKISFEDMSIFEVLEHLTLTFDLNQRSRSLLPGSLENPYWVAPWYQG